MTDNLDCASCPSAEGCPSAAGGDCPSQENAQDFAAQLHPASRVRHVFAVASGKGGVGKSSLTALLAVSLARQGLSVAVLDADLTGPSMAQAFGVDGHATQGMGGIIPARTRTGIQLMSINLLLADPSQPVVWRGPVLASVVKQFYSEVIWEDVDVMLVDMPPGTGDVPLTVYQSLPISGLMMVTTPQDLVHMIVRKAGQMAEMMNVPLLGLIENMSWMQCPHCEERIYPFGEGHAAEAATLLGVPLIAELPLLPEINRLIDEGRIEEIPTDPLEAASDLIITMTSRTHGETDA